MKTIEAKSVEYTKEIEEIICNINGAFVEGSKQDKIFIAALRSTIGDEKTDKWLKSYTPREAVTKFTELIYKALSEREEDLKVSHAKFTDWVRENYREALNKGKWHNAMGYFTTEELYVIYKEKTNEK